jgi:ribosomal protein L24
MRGIFAGKTAKVARVDTKEYKVYLEGITRRRTIGTEVQVPIHPSNLKIINPVLDDEERRKILLRKVKEVVYEKPKEEKTEKKKIEEKPKEEKQKEEKVELQEVKYGEVEKAPSAKVLARSTKGVKVGRRPQRRIPSKV